MTSRAADEVAAKREGSRAPLVEDALRPYLRVQDLAWDEASPRKCKPLRGGDRKSERGRPEIARGEFVSFEEIKRDLEADGADRRTAAGVSPSRSCRPRGRDVCSAAAGVRWKIFLLCANEGRQSVVASRLHLSLCGLPIISRRTHYCLAPRARCQDRFVRQWAVLASGWSASKTKRTQGEGPERMFQTQTTLKAKQTQGAKPSTQGAKPNEPKEWRQINGLLGCADERTRAGWAQRALG